LTYANIVSSLALFVALGGTSYAVARNSIGNRELKKDAVTSSKVRDRAIKPIDLSTAVRTNLRGPRGPQGPTGATGSVDATPEPWQALTFDQRFSNYLAGFQVAQFRKDQLGRVSLRGLVTRNDALPAPDEVIGTLPPGYRPPATLIFGAEVVNGDGRLDVRPNGEIAFRGGPVQSERDYADLAGISFWTD
jgi:hypothetical protein